VAAGFVRDPDLTRQGPVATREAPAQTARRADSEARPSAARLLAEARAEVEPAYRAAVDGLPAEVRHVVGYHIGWWDADGQPTARTGKSVRPALVLACARAARRTDGPPDAAVAVAVVVELVHDFSLLHDDVMDGDPTRRHRPAAWKVFGASRAILAGDALQALAMNVICDTALRSPMGTSASTTWEKVLSRALLALCAGQSADLAFAERGEVTLAECLAMAEGKTGTLLGAACQLGAMAAGSRDPAASCYREFGRQLGLAFQLADDSLGIWGDPAVTGKPIGSDLRARKKSLPVVAALASGTAAGEHLALLYRREEELDDHAVARAARLVEQAGGRDWAADEARRRTAAALTALAQAEPDPDADADLRALAALMTRRDH
jgi:geranylgeranyl diphosphate synthase type I